MKKCVIDSITITVNLLFVGSVLVERAGRNKSEFRCGHRKKWSVVFTWSEKVATGMFCALANDPIDRVSGYKDLCLGFWGKPHKFVMTGRFTALRGTMNDEDRRYR